MLGYEFGEPDWLVRALTHPSHAAEQSARPATNQRLEFLGDAVLQVVVSELLFRRHPDMQEGQLSKVRSAVTNADALAEMARELGFGEYLRLGRGEEQSGGRHRDSNLADAFEAVIGAIYLDGGLAPAAAFVEASLAGLLEDPDCLLSNENPKGALQEYTQLLYQEPPEYEVLSVAGPEHMPCFSVQVVINGRPVAVAVSGSRKGAEKMAARAALRELRATTKPSTEDR